MTVKSSIDEHELSKFNKTTEEWWDLNGEFKLLHEINPLRIEYIISKINDAGLSLKEAKIIDVGSGGGLICSPLSRLGADVTGIDANEYNTKAAAGYAQDNDLNIKYLNKTVEEYVASKEQYDVVLCLEVIEHVANPAEFVSNVAKLVAPGGILIFSTINRTAKSYALTIMMAEYVLGWVPKGTHDHSKFIKPSEFNNMLENSEMKLAELKGMSLSLASNQWYLSDDIDVNYFAVFKA
ncbi:bifunctional 2-polyprenyl-6-hydroxyphenol methylase/3-demethylubiquinol 3-O-methyltransferase UbiG [Rickettsiaceae bacterium]|nr:bifunctional 2-polyprenyl-6-hydroxyphenol methylase/3-demethylubiquinol 3-O-methyltransferase UbiG [Rickettsiaceae bacterium]